jgi:hypothetical protein
MPAITGSIRIPISISPRGRAGDVVGGQIVGVGGEHGGDLFPHGRIEKLLGNQGDDLVSFVAPRECRSGVKGEEARDECESDHEAAQGGNPRRLIR